MLYYIQSFTVLFFVFMPQSRFVVGFEEKIGARIFFKYMKKLPRCFERENLPSRVSFCFSRIRCFVFRSVHAVRVYEFL